MYKRQGVTSDDALAIRTAPQFQPIMEWKANVSLVKDIQPGVTVSYGRHFKAEVCTRVATLAVGYADGFPRSVSNQGACVLLHGRRVPIIGNICMDQMMVDITGLDGVSEGDVATLIGCDGDEVLSVDELSRLAPVSYTHLDVYKRQAEMGGAGRIKAIAKCPAFPSQNIAGADTLDAADSS